MKLERRILVATDLSESADEALREGARFAKQTNSPLGVVHVTAEKDLRHQELVVRARVANVIGAQPVEVFVERGVDHAAIGRRALDWKADMIVVGARASAVLGHLFRGVGERLILDAHCPVLVARPFHGDGGVIAATDLSKPELPAVVAAAQEAERRGARLKVVHAVGFWSAEARYLSTPTPTIETQSDYAAFADELESAVAEIGIDQPCQVLTGSAARAIVRNATETDAELIVLAKHDVARHHARVASRGVVENVFASAPCSVLVVPTLAAP